MNAARVNARHLAAESRREIARRTADAAAEIQRPAGWLEASGAGQFFGGNNASEVELVKWRELSDGQRLSFGCDGRERGPDQACEAGGGIVLTHFGSRDDIDHVESSGLRYQSVPGVG